MPLESLSLSEWADIAHESRLRGRSFAHFRLRSRPAAGQWPILQGFGRMLLGAAVFAK
ncbi:MAG: hypothetical protein ACREDZ_15670 [Kiloniellales bacterium]